jgi:hypothetical protein
MPSSPGECLSSAAFAQSPEHRSGCTVKVFHKRLERQFARFFAGIMSAHAVGDHHQQARGRAVAAGYFGECVGILLPVPRPAHLSAGKIFFGDHGF